MARDVTATKPSGPRGAKFWKRAFLASLAVNLLVLGVIGGALLKGPPEPRDKTRDAGFGPFAGALDEADRKELRRDFIERSNGGAAFRAGMRADMEAVLQALRAEPFDPATLDAAMAQQGSRFSDQMALGRTLLRDRIVAMTPEARLRFAERLEDSLKRHGDGRKGGPKP
ncbi:periplasmic heavy metal sensor [Gemmobacter serpentinus]|uniref:periplasmic heavy metal sensor n=1 Tax=Gemmobacter serpentinus TaxID=2652247 RepID=UPI00124EC62B|nr:periplasmic heavy metal sensor [Gemmobacter serpentinus]